MPMQCVISAVQSLSASQIHQTLHKKIAESSTHNVVNDSSCAVPIHYSKALSVLFRFLLSWFSSTIETVCPVPDFWLCSAAFSKPWTMTVWVEWCFNSVSHCVYVMVFTLSNTEHQISSDSNASRVSEPSGASRYSPGRRGWPRVEGLISWGKLKINNSLKSLTW